MDVHGKKGNSSVIRPWRLASCIASSPLLTMLCRYVLKKESKDLELILIATGSEVQLAYEASKQLEEQGVGTRVVSMPSTELFDAQGDEYKESVIPKEKRKRLAIEAASPFGWYKYVGCDGKVLAMESFGASAPADELFEKFGFTTDNVVKSALELLKGE